MRNRPCAHRHQVGQVDALLLCVFMSEYLLRFPIRVLFSRQSEADFYTDPYAAVPRTSPTPGAEPESIRDCSNCH